MEHQLSRPLGDDADTSKLEEEFDAMLEEEVVVPPNTVLKLVLIMCCTEPRCLVGFAQP